MKVWVVLDQHEYDLGHPVVFATEAQAKAYFLECIKDALSCITASVSPWLEYHPDPRTLADDDYDGWLTVYNAEVSWLNHTPEMWPCEVEQPSIHDLSEPDLDRVLEHMYGKDGLAAIEAWIERQQDDGLEPEDKPIQ